MVFVGLGQCGRWSRRISEGSSQQNVGQESWRDPPTGQLTDRHKPSPPCQCHSGCWAVCGGTG